MLYVGAVSDSMYLYSAYLFHVVAILYLLVQFFSLIFKCKIVFLNALSYNEMTQCICTDVRSFICVAFIFFNCILKFHVESHLED